MRDISARELKGHNILAVERFRDNTRWMIEFSVLRSGSYGSPGDEMRLFLTEDGYQAALLSQQRRDIKIKRYARVIEGHLAAEYATSYKACTAGALLCVVRHRCFLSGSCGRNDCPSGPRLCPEQVHPITSFPSYPRHLRCRGFLFFPAIFEQNPNFSAKKLQPIFCVPGLLLAQLRA